MNSDTLPAGRELDALVAERVMGWSNVSLGALGNDAFGWNPSLRGHVPPHGRIPIPCYSTSIQAAWEVAEKLVERRRYLAVQRQAGEYNHTWSACFWEIGENGVLHIISARGVATSAPLAICRAALKAGGA